MTVRFQSKPDNTLHVTRPAQAKTRPKRLFQAGFLGEPGGIRTHDLLIRSQTLYPAELRAHMRSVFRSSFMIIAGDVAKCNTKTATFSGFRAFRSALQHVFLLPSASGLFASGVRIPAVFHAERRSTIRSMLFSRNHTLLHGLPNASPAWRRGARWEGRFISVCYC